MRIRKHFGQRVDSSISFAVTLLVLIAITACADSDMNNSTGVRTTIDTLGDTITVHTISGNVWGEVELTPEMRIGALDGAEHEILGSVRGLQVDDNGNIYLVDTQAPALRKYAPDGEYLTTFGREGRGPGEYVEPDGGLAVLTDGRVIIRDPGNGRISVYGADGSYIDSWPIAGNMFTSSPMFAASDGGAYNPSYTGDVGALVQYGANGAPGDTMPFPDRGLDRPILRAQARGRSSSTWVPFVETAPWGWNPADYFLSGVSGSDHYLVDHLRPDGTMLRIKKSNTRVPISAAERSASEEQITRSMTNVDPSWSWNGPQIPDHKPAIIRLFGATDGRTWVQLHQPGELVAGSDTGTTRDGRPRIPTFREPIVFDVFETDGTFLGRVRAPNGMSITVTPTFRGDNVWAVETDELGVQYVVRYRIAPTATN